MEITEITSKHRAFVPRHESGDASSLSRSDHMNSSTKGAISSKEMLRRRAFNFCCNALNSDASSSSISTTISFREPRVVTARVRLSNSFSISSPTPSLSGRCKNCFNSALVFGKFLNCSLKTAEGKVFGKFVNCSIKTVEAKDSSKDSSDSSDSSDELELERGLQDLGLSVLSDDVLMVSSSAKSFGGKLGEGTPAGTLAKSRKTSIGKFEFVRFRVSHISHQFLIISRFEIPIYCSWTKNTNPAVYDRFNIQDFSRCCRTLRGFATRCQAKRSWFSNN